MPTEDNSNGNSKSSTKSRVKSKTRSRRRGFSLVRQRDSMQCGAACLTMVCRHFGADASLDDVDQVLCATNDGVSLLAISRVADSSRLDNAAGRLSLERLRQALQLSETLRLCVRIIQCLKDVRLNMNLAPKEPFRGGGDAAIPYILREHGTPPIWKL